jgi:hypothetical protein
MSETGTSSNQGRDQPQATPGSGKIVMLSGDLMFASRVRAVAQSQGFAFHFGGSLPEGDLSTVRFVILDLSTRSGLIDQVARDCAERCPDATLIAYGPHVQTDLLRRAREAGIANVMTNGQFNASLTRTFNP